MSIRTKLNPLGGVSGKKNKAYLLFGTNYIDIATLGYTQNIDPDKSFADNSGNIGVANAKVLCLNGTLASISMGSTITLRTVADSTKNYSKLSSVNLGYFTNSLFIADSQLYIGTNPGGSYTVLSVDSSRTYLDCLAISSRGALAITDGALIAIYNPGLSTRTYETLKTYNNFAKVCGSIGSTRTANVYALAIVDGGLYYISNTSSTASSPDYSITQLVNTTGWTDITGYSNSGNGYCAFGINSGKLYFIPIASNKQVVQAGSSSTWTKITGTANKYTGSLNDVYAYGIAGGKLYALSFTVSGSAYTPVTDQIGSLDTWSDIVVGYSNTNMNEINQTTKNYAYGIADGELYCIKGTTVTKINDLKPISIYGYSAISSNTIYSSNSSPAIVICEE